MKNLKKFTVKKFGVTISVPAYLWDFISTEAEAINTSASEIVRWAIIGMYADEIFAFLQEKYKMDDAVAAETLYITKAAESDRKIQIMLK